MSSKYILNFFLFACLSQTSFAKEVCYRADSRVVQTKFTIRSGEAFFTEKYQNVNGNIIQSWHMNDTTISKVDFDRLICEAEKEEEIIKKEEIERVLREEEEKKKELLAQKKKEEELFVQQAKLQALKRLVSLELQDIERSFFRLDEYKLDEYFVFESDSFISKESLQDARVILVGQAKSLTLKPVEELDAEELKDVLNRLEVLPDKIERFFRQSVKYAVNNCNDTKRLKELLALI